MTADSDWGVPGELWSAVARHAQQLPSLSALLDDAKLLAWYLPNSSRCIAVGATENELLTRLHHELNLTICAGTHKTMTLASACILHSPRNAYVLKTKTENLQLRWWRLP